MRWDDLRRSPSTITLAVAPGGVHSPPATSVQLLDFDSFVAPKCACFIMDICHMFCFLSIREKRPNLEQCNHDVLTVIGSLVPIEACG